MRSTVPRGSDMPGASHTARCYGPGDMDWDTVPGVLAGASFLRDRRNADRSQVDLVGAWGEASYGHVRPDSVAPLDPVTIYMHLRNASELPVIVKQLAYEVETHWAVKDTEYSWEMVDAAKPTRAFVNDVQLAPGETKATRRCRCRLRQRIPEK